jgi:hypothetical protein
MSRMAGRERETGRGKRTEVYVQSVYSMEMLYSGQDRGGGGNTWNKRVLEGGTKTYDAGNFGRVFA